MRASPLELYFISRSDARALFLVLGVGKEIVGHRRGGVAAALR
jgi:hypothetical protein